MINRARFIDFPSNQSPGTHGGIDQVFNTDNLVATDKTWGDIDRLNPPSYV